MCLIAEPEQQLRVIHVGGRRDDPVAVYGGDAPESAQLVLEPDVEFTVFVRRHLRLPTCSRIKVDGTDGRPGVAQPRDGTPTSASVRATLGSVSTAREGRRPGLNNILTPTCARALLTGFAPVAWKSRMPRSGRSAERSGGTSTTRAPRRRNQAASGAQALRAGSITTNTSARSVPSGSIDHNRARSCGVVWNRRPVQINRPSSSARLT